jgi:hypothetical protein
MSQDEYTNIVLSHLRSLTHIDLDFNLLPLHLQLKIKKASELLKRLMSLKMMINFSLGKRKKILTFKKNELIKEEEEYKFIYERLEKEYNILLEEIAEEIKHIIP